MRGLVAGCLFVIWTAGSTAAMAQASSVQFSAVVCGPSGLAGVTYATESGRPVLCGTDSSGDALVLQVSTLSPDAPVEGGEQTGADIGAALLLVMAVAWGVKVMRRMMESSAGEG